MKEQGEVKRLQSERLMFECDGLVIEKTALALRYKDHLSILWKAHEDLLEAEVRLAEASSDFEVLSERNRGIVEQLEDERRSLKNIEQEALMAREAASKALRVCEAIHLEDPEPKEFFDSLPPGFTLEALQNDIDAEKSKLDYVQAGNSNAIREYERRQVDVDKLSEKLAGHAAKLESLTSKLDRLRAQWEPKLDELVGQISAAFSYNFERIGCAGEVSVHKDEDFEKWSIEIKVKFR
jgi:chromosome segregation ATPase